MELKEYQFKILDLLKEHEKGLSELYAVFAEKCPDYKQFWSDLSKEEKEHAEWVDKLAEMINGREIFFNRERFNLEAIKSSLGELRSDIVKNKNSEVSPINTLSVSYYYEMALIDRKFFEVFESDFVELKHTLNHLLEETKKHQEKVKEALEKERAKNEKN